MNEVAPRYMIKAMNMTIKKKSLITLSIAGALTLFVGCQTEKEPTPAPATSMSAVDLHNTICPVSIEPVANSKLVEVYNGKVYHLCCGDCRADFEKDPAKYETAVALSPAKYGVK